MTSRKPFSAAEILGVRVDKVDVSGLLAFIQEALDSHVPRSIFYLNVHTWNLARANPDFLRILADADVVYCDGYGIRLGGWILGESLPARMTAPELVDEVCSRCAADGRNLYILAGEEGVAKSAAEKLENRHPGLKVLGYHNGYLSDSRVDSMVVEDIRRLSPDLLIVGMGSPKQEQWIHRNLQNLNVKIAWAVGAMFDFVVGKTRRAPQWLSNYGFEWLHRFLIEPRRMWRRYLIGNTRFLAAVLAARIRGRKVH